MMRSISYKVSPVIALLLLASSYTLLAGGTSIDDVLILKEEPAGVVFEIVSGDEDALRWAIPTVKRHIDKLRERFPELSIAVVSHGREQFALTKNNQQKYKHVHTSLQALSKQAGVPVHVCETYANRNGVDADEFPEYIDVAAAGPAQINDYRALGYILIVVRQPAG